jgi:DNA repair exonuclease SbcCD nuclease subunit
LITDQHFGGKSDSQSFNEYIEKFYTNQFFPYLKENNIDTVIDLGDTFDRRKYVNFAILDKVRKYYFDELARRNITLYSIVGNHSSYYRNTNSVNSSKLLYGHYDNVKVFWRYKQIEIDGTKIDLIPWINSENYDDTMDFIKRSDAQIAFGHLEVEGFAMYKNYVAGTGLQSSIFNRYELVASGHYHHKSSKGNIHYLGAPYEITWNDYDDPRGFHIFDTETRELEFIQNKYRLFEKIYYDDENIDYRSVSGKPYKNKIVKLIVENKSNVTTFESFLDRLYKSNPIDLIILEDLSEYTARYSNLEEGEDIEVGNTATFLEEYVDSIPIDHDKKDERLKVKRLLQILYDEALNTDE